MPCNPGWPICSTTSTARRDPGWPRHANRYRDLILTAHFLILPFHFHPGCNKRARFGYLDIGPPPDKQLQTSSRHAILIPHRAQSLYPPAAQSPRCAHHRCCLRSLSGPRGIASTTSPIRHPRARSAAKTGVPGHGDLGARFRAEASRARAQGSGGSGGAGKASARAADARGSQGAPGDARQNHGGR